MSLILQNIAVNLPVGIVIHLQHKYIVLDDLHDSHL